MKTRWIKPFLCSAGAILLGAAAIRFAIAAGSAKTLDLPEPMLGFPIRYAALAVGGFELLIALVCLFGKQVGLQTACLAWLATNFIAYWVCLLAMHCHPQATCIGSLTDPLRLSRGTIGSIMALLPLYLLLGSYAALPCLWFGKPEPVGATERGGSGCSPSPELKMPCPGCGTHIQFPAEYAGCRTQCPICQRTMVLRLPENLRMSCPSCQQHIEFPAHAVGQRIPCPHCNMGIILKDPS